MPVHLTIFWETDQEQAVRTSVNILNSWQKKMNEFISFECDKFMNLPPKAVGFRNFVTSRFNHQCERSVNSDW